MFYNKVKQGFLSQWNRLEECQIIFSPVLSYNISFEESRNFITVHGRISFLFNSFARNNRKWKYDIFIGAIKYSVTLENLELCRFWLLHAEARYIWQYKFCLVRNTIILLPRKYKNSDTRYLNTVGSYNYMFVMTLFIIDCVNFNIFLFLLQVRIKVATGIVNKWQRPKM